MKSYEMNSYERVIAAINLLISELQRQKAEQELSQATSSIANDVKRAISYNIKNSGVSASEIAKRSGLAVNTVYYVIDGAKATSLDTLEKLAGAIGMTLKEILSEK